MRKVGLILLAVILQSGCVVQDVDTQVEPELQEMVAEQLSTSQDMLSFAYDSDVLANVVQEEINRWQNPQQTITFTLKNTLNTDHYVIGLYDSPTEWFFSGRVDLETTFKMTNQADSVTLEYGANKDKLAPEEFTFMLPKYHLEVLQSVLQEKQFQRLAWGRYKQGWQVEMDCSITSLLPDITAYLTHGEKHDSSIAHNLEGYSVSYAMWLTSTDDQNLKIERLQYTVKKQAITIDQLEFDF